MHVNQSFMLWRSNIEDVYTKNKNGHPPPQRSTYLSHFWMVFIIYNAFFAVANSTTILKVISDCLMLQNTEKRSIFLHAYIQTVKKPPIFLRLFVPFGFLRKIN